MTEQGTKMGAFVKKDALLILSGGMDSATLLYEQANQIGEVLTFDYGSKHNAEEIKRAKALTAEFELPWSLCSLKFLAEHFKSDLLLTGSAIAQREYNDGDMKKTVVPFRNGIMLSIAVGLADSLGLKRVIYGAHAGDHAIYPDCRPDFIRNMAYTASCGTYGGIEIEAPFKTYSKRDIGERGQSIGVDWSKTYSCYIGGETHCGVCPTCIERRKALHGFDPTEYEQELAIA